MRSHPGAWLAWLVAVMGLVLVLDDPAVSLTALGVLVVVGASVSSRAPESRAWLLFLKIGLVFIALRVVLFALTGHTGATTVATLPALRLPAWLGGLTLGGRVTAEVVAHSAAEGLKIAVLLVSIGVAQSAVAPHRILRMLPRSLFEAGLIVGIALTFIPTMLRAASDIRDAQRARGHRARGLRSLRALVIPVLASGLDRALTLAASMETRGYGRRVVGDPRAERAARAALTVGMLALVGGACLVLFGRASGLAPAAAGAVLAAGGLRILGARTQRTRLRRERIEASDAVLLGCAAASIVVVLAARAAGVGGWSPYPAFTWPTLHASSVLLGLMPVAPAVVDSVRRAKLRRASAAHAQAAAAAGIIR